MLLTVDNFITICGQLDKSSVTRGTENCGTVTFEVIAQPFQQCYARFKPSELLLDLRHNPLLFRQRRNWHRYRCEIST